MAEQVIVKPRIPVTQVPGEEKLPVIASEGGATGAPSEAKVVEVTREPPKSSMVKILPLLTVNMMRIGATNYQFVARREREVPREIVPLLIERGIVAPSI
jgi:hypothetical protein